ncbi:MAG: DUF488 family protein [Nitrososphaerota archaeon]
MIKTKCVYDPVDLESDRFRILIMRKWPRGIGYKKHSIHKWSKELGPSRQLLDKWNRNEIAWGDYVKQYSAEHICSVAAKIETESIAKMSIHKTVTLLCKERENDPHCHRQILKNIVNRIANKSRTRRLPR